VKSNLLKVRLTVREVDYLIYLIQHPRVMIGEKERLESHIATRPKLSDHHNYRRHTVCNRQVDASALAFAPLRYVPEGVYITTWTIFLPNIS
jgi:hypothetical protein